ncbi:uncharacterized protein LOC128215300 [Mya arenaria]|uniref:uncharacterized protein LOC128215300 n=1 Tax=Mya arenaria TaxID=6604 RepID=UPI0022E35095|nr:uncharacterized protein LOC128215300 [Mya arenaria]
MTKKRKDRNSSGNNSNKSKSSKPRGPSEEHENSFSVSEVLGRASAVLFQDTNESAYDDTTEVFATSTKIESDSSFKMAEGGREPTNKDLLDCMKKMGEKLCVMEKKLNSIEALERKVTDFEKDLRKLWIALEDRVKRTDDRVNKLEDKVESADVDASVMAERVTMLERQREELRDDIAYLKSQSMRNNLVFTNIPEDNATGSEPADVTEAKLRNHLHETLKIAKDR